MVLVGDKLSKVMSFGAKNVLQALNGSAEQPTTATYAPVYWTDSPHILESLMVVYTRSYGYILVASMAQGPLHYFFISNSDSIRSWIQVTVWSQKDEGFKSSSALQYTPCLENNYTR